MQNQGRGETYTPGQCNIGPVEVRRRMWTGHFGLFLVFVCILLLEILHAPQIYKLILFCPLVVAFSGYFQAYQKFCYLYGIRGVFSMKGRQLFTRVKDSVALARDRRLAIKLIVQVILASLLFTAIYYFIGN